MRRFVLGLGIGGLLLVAASAASAEPVIIKCARPCTAVIQAVERNGGVITYRYKYINAVAADVTTSALTAVRGIAELGAVRKDHLIQLPNAGSEQRGLPGWAQTAATNVRSLGEAQIRSLAAAASPNAYTINNAAMNLTALHAGGTLGQGMKVAVIDSGLRPNFPHITLDGSILGGEDFVPDAPGFIDVANNGHGTFVAGMISGNVTFGIAGLLRNSLALHCPSCATPVSATVSALPLLGSAPLSSIYALRVFPAVGGAPESRIMAAMDRVIELRDNFDSGMPETKNPDGSYTALNITVCNMSLGGPTLYAGRDLESELAEAFLEHDIVLVTSAGNAGPSGSTGGSPGTAFDSLTVGATSSAVHERVLRDLQQPTIPGFGLLFRPFGGVQTAYFSSRGPTADGRIDPDVMANGFASFGQGFGTAPGGIDIASGTSFASPSVAGVAAVLRQAVPHATARQIRNALMLSANRSIIADGSGANDRGWGHVDAGTAVSLLGTGLVPDIGGLHGLGSPSVELNILFTGVLARRGDVSRRAANLKPGQRSDTYYVVPKDTSLVTITVSDVVAGATQNPLFGDDILLTVHSAKTSALGEGDYAVFSFTKGGTFTVPNKDFPFLPDTGLMRITMSGDWTNASPISATVSISSQKTPTPGKSAQHKIQEGQTYAYEFVVAPGTKRLDAELEWDEDWGSYPTNDLDLFLIPPTGAPNFDGATLNAPERAGIDNPAAGNWVAVVDGFSVSSRRGDKFGLRLAVDGKVVKLK
jgi:hypothetical protein